MKSEPPGLILTLPCTVVPDRSHPGPAAPVPVIVTAPRAPVHVVDAEPPAGPRASTPVSSAAAARANRFIVASRRRPQRAFAARGVPATSERRCGEYRPSACAMRGRRAGLARRPRFCECPLAGGIQVVPALAPARGQRVEHDD